MGFRDLIDLEIHTAQFIGHHGWQSLGRPPVEQAPSLYYGALLFCPNDCWSMDFLSDQLFDGRKIRILSIVDNFSRLSPALDVRQSYRGADVVQTLEGIAAAYGRPKRIRLDNGPEFISKDLDLWAWTHSVILDFSRPGKPTDNAFAESFNGRVRAECLNAFWFLSLEDAQVKCEA